MSAYDKTSIQINRCKRILALVDDYVEKQDAATRTDLRKALMEEFEAPAIAPPVAAGSVDIATLDAALDGWVPPSGVLYRKIVAWGAQQREAGQRHSWDQCATLNQEAIRQQRERAEKAEADLKARDFFVDVLNSQVKKAQGEADILFHRLNAANGHLAMARERIEELETEIKVLHRG